MTSSRFATRDRAMVGGIGAPLDKTICDPHTPRPRELDSSPLRKRPTPTRASGRG